MNPIIFGQPQPDIVYGKRPGAYAVIYNECQQVAIVQVQPYFWLPGGGVEGNETIEDCLHRELAEELGWSIQVQSFIGEASQYGYFADLKAYLVKQGFFFIAQKTGDLNQVTEADHHLVWMDPQQAIQNLTHDMYKWAVQQTCSP
jgi:8-oxo-dGTP diphosphatase